LKEKLREETEEFNESENEEELADILEVIDAICGHKNFKAENILKIKQTKAKERGEFKERIILEES
jgi:predicted house-cleaning noncanonical NTP pyrophosphatase (MazG superfamily)